VPKALAGTLLDAPRRATNTFEVGGPNDDIWSTSIEGGVDARKKALSPWSRPHARVPGVARLVVKNGMSVHLTTAQPDIQARVPEIREHMILTRS